MKELRKRVKKHCSKDVPEETCLLELGWYTREVVVSYLTCERCGKRGCYVEENRGQGVISNKRFVRGHLHLHP